MHHRIDRMQPRRRRLLADGRTGGSAASPTRWLRSAGVGIVLLVATACGSSSDSTVATAVQELPAAPPLAPPSSQADSKPVVSSTVADSGAMSIAPFTVRNERGYEYEVSIEVGPRRLEITPGDPGKSHLMGAWSWSMVVTNELDDRPAPFVTTNGKHPGVLLYFPVDPAVAAQADDVATYPRKARNLGGVAHLALTVPFRDYGDYESEGVYEMAAGGSETVVATSGQTFNAPLVSIAGDQYGWPDALIEELRHTFDREPTYVSVTFDPDTFDARNCTTDFGALRFLYDVERGSWSTPEELGWGTGDEIPCEAPEWESSEGASAEAASAETRPEPTDAATADPGRPVNDPATDLVFGVEQLSSMFTVAPTSGSIDRCDDEPFPAAVSLISAGVPFFVVSVFDDWSAADQALEATERAIAAGATCHSTDGTSFTFVPPSSVERLNDIALRESVTIDQSGSVSSFTQIEQRCGNAIVAAPESDLGPVLAEMGCLD